MEREIRIECISPDGGTYRATLYVDNREVKTVEGAFGDVLEVLCKKWDKEGSFSWTTDLVTGRAMASIFRLSGLLD